METGLMNVIDKHSFIDTVASTEGVADYSVLKSVECDKEYIYVNRMCGGVLKKDTLVYSGEELEFVIFEQTFTRFITKTLKFMHGDKQPQLDHLLNEILEPVVSGELFQKASIVIKVVFDLTIQNPTTAELYNAPHITYVENGKINLGGKEIPLDEFPYIKVEDENVYKAWRATATGKIKVYPDFGLINGSSNGGKLTTNVSMLAVLKEVETDAVIATVAAKSNAVTLSEISTILKSLDYFDHADYFECLRLDEKFGEVVTENLIRVDSGEMVYYGDSVLIDTHASSHGVKNDSQFNRGDRVKFVMSAVDEGNGIISWLFGFGDHSSNKKILTLTTTTV